MRISKTIRNMLLKSMMLLAAAAVTTSCIKDDLSDCSKAFNFTVKAVDNSGANIDGQVQDVVLYIFDAQNRFVRQIPTTTGARVAIEPLAGDMRIIVWGNLSSGAPVCAPGEDILTRRICLAPDTRAASPFYSPGDLFFGQTTLPQNDQTGEKVIAVTRKTGSMNVTIKKLREFTGFTDNDFSIRVGDTHSEFELSGAACGAMALYRPDGAFAVNEYKVPSFNMLCDPNLYIDIYHGTTKIYTVNSHNGGLPIAVEEGKTTQVVIDFTGEVSVSVSILPWGSTSTDKEF